MFENDDSGIAVANGFTILQFRPSFLPLSTSLSPLASRYDVVYEPMDETLSLIES